MVAAGAVMVAAALPVAVMGVGTASAATTAPSLFCSQNDTIAAGGYYNYAGSPYCGSLPWGYQNGVIQFNVFGSNFAFDNGSASATTTAPGVTVLGVTEDTTYSATVTLAIGATTTPGYYGLSITDDNGTGSLATAFGVDPASTITSYTPTSISQGSTVLITVTGVGLSSGTVSPDFADPGGFGATAGVANAAGTSLTFYASSTASLALGTYGVDILGANTTNVDGNAGINITVTGATITSISPNEYSNNVTLLSISSTLVISGSGFQPGAIVRINGQVLPATIAGGGFSHNELVMQAPVVVNSTTIDIPVTNVDTGTFDAATYADVQVTNPDGDTFLVSDGLGWDQPGLLPVTTSSLTVLSDNLTPGPSDVCVTSASGFPLSIGDSATLSYGRFTFTGSVTSVGAPACGANQYAVSFDLPAFLSTTLSAAVTAGANSLPVASLSGIVPGATPLTFVDATGDTIAAGNVLGTVSSTQSVTVTPLADGHASGTSIQWPIGSDLGWAMVVNNGTATLTASALSIGAQPTPSYTYHRADGTMGPASPFITPNYIDPLAPGTYTFLMTDPGGNFAKTGSTITFEQGGTNPAGLTGTIVATGTDTATVTVTMPSTGTAPVYTATSVTFTNATSVGQTNIPVSGTLTDLTPGSYYEVNSAGTDHEMIQVSPTWNGASPLILASGLAENHLAGATVSSIAYPPGLGAYNAVINNGNGQVDTIPFATLAPTDFTLSGINDVAAGVPAPPGMVLGAGASNVPIWIYGGFAGSTNPADYVVTSTTAGVTFGPVTNVDDLASPNGFIQTSVSIAAGTPINTNVQYTVTELGGQGTGSLPSNVTVNSGFLIGVGPTVTGVTGLPATLLPGETYTFGVTGTLFDATTVSDVNAGNTGFYATTGDLAGLLDTGTVLGNSHTGITTTCVLNSSTSLSCSVMLGKGSVNGPHTLVLDNSQWGTASLPNALTVANATIGSVSPMTYQSDSLTVPFTLSGLSGYTVGQNTSSIQARATTFYPNGAVASSDGFLVTTYGGPNTLVVQVPGGMTRPPGGFMVITLYGNPGSTGYDVAADSAVIPLGEPLVVTATGVATPAGTSSPFAISALNSTFGAPFNGPTTFLKGATVTAPAGSGVTVSGVSVLPGLITGTVAIAPGTPAGVIVLTVTNPDGGIAYSNLTVTPSPVITAVNGTPVLTGPVAFLGGSSATLTITGANFEIGAVVSDSVSGDATFGATSVNAAGTILTVSVTFIAFSGATPLSTNLVVTNPDGGVGVVVGELVINPVPAVTGGPYYVATFTSNTEVVMTGTGFQAGMTVASSNADYTVSIANVLPTAVTLLVTTDSAATEGTFTTLTFTNPDGGSTTVRLTGGPVPVPKPMYKSIVGRPAKVGTTTTFVITGSNLGGMSASVNKAGVSVHKWSNNSTEVTVKVTVGKKVKGGTTAKLTLRNAAGQLVITFTIKK